MMRLIVITDTPFIAGEGGIIRQLLDEGIDRVHLRKPGANPDQMRRLIESLPAAYHPRLSLQDCQSLALEYGIGGVHLNARSPQPPLGFEGIVSCSCHSLEELATHPEEDYLFLSPIFDSISKSGYRAAFTPEQLREATRQGIINRRIVALGGIRPEHLPTLRDFGFGGAALLGCIWRDTSTEGLRQTLQAIRKFNDR